MNIIQIKTIGEVALPSTMNSSIGYLYDIPMDELGLPYLPIRGILEDAGCQLPDVKLGFAHLDGYMSLIKSSNALKDNIVNCIPLIHSYFVNERFLPEKMCKVRSLKEGLVFNAHIYFDEKDKETLQNALAKVTHIGIVDEMITGEVSIELLSLDQQMEHVPVLSEKCNYTSLDISYLLRTPACFPTPYADGVTTASYIPGAVLRNEMMNKLTKDSIHWDQLTFSNAYISMNGQRLLPTPICVSVVKQDKEQLRYRLAPGKNPKITEQDKGLEGTYTNESHQHMVHYTKPETERVVSKDGEMYDALCSGQIFQGTIYGPDEEIRRIAKWISHNPVTNIGALSEEGFGEVLCLINQVKEEKIREENLHRCFDVCCISDTLILNEKGMPTCRAEDLLDEIEYRLGVSKKLRIVGKYTNVFHDFSRNYQWQEDRGVVRCFAKGSILRLEAVDEPIDIFPIQHCFLGERTKEGYGEICAWPARGEYYRLAENVLLPQYDVSIKESPRDMTLGARMTKGVINAILKRKVQAMAAADQREYEEGRSIEELLPIEFLVMFREQYDPRLSHDEIVLWYTEMLKGGNGV